MNNVSFAEKRRTVVKRRIAARGMASIHKRSDGVRASIRIAARSSAERSRLAMSTPTVLCPPPATRQATLVPSWLMEPAIPAGQRGFRFGPTGMLRAAAAPIPSLVSAVDAYLDKQAIDPQDDVALVSITRELGRVG